MKELKEQAQDVVIRNMLYELLLKVQETENAQDRIKLVNDSARAIRVWVNAIDNDFKTEIKNIKKTKGDM